MNESIVELLLLAGVAVFVMSRLFSVLGKQRGLPPGERGADRSDTQRPAKPVHADNGRANENANEEAYLGDPIDGLDEIAGLDPSFSRRDFLTGAKSAYEMIVTAFADGNRTTLRPLLTDDVFQAYDEAITARNGSDEGVLEFMRLKNATLESGEIDGDDVLINVAFEAELSDGERLRQTKEVWTFERNIKANDPNWRLSGVEAIS